MRNTRSFTKSRIVTAAALVLTTMGVGTVGSAIQASATPTNLGGALVGAVIQQAGHITGITFDNGAASGFPGAYHGSATIVLSGATKADGTAVDSDGTTPNSAGYVAIFCGNYTSNSPSGVNRALTAADVSNPDFVLGKCATQVLATSVGGSITATVAFDLNEGSAAIVDTFVAGTPSVAAKLKGSTTAEVLAVAPVPAADIPATLFAPFKAKGSTITEVLAVSPVPPADIAAVDAVADSGVHGADAVEGTTCVPNNTVVPCLVLITKIADNAAFAMAVPAVNPSAVSVVGRVGLAGGVCNPSSAPPTGCAAARLTTDPTAPYPVIIGGAGFAPNHNTLNVAFPGSDSTQVTLKVCSDPSNTACLDGPAPAGPAPAVGSTGSIAPAAIVISPIAGISAGDRFLQVTARHEVAALPLAFGGPCDFTAALGPNLNLLGFVAAASVITTGTVCQLTQTYYTSIKIMAATSSLAIANGVLTGSSLEPRSHLSIQIRDTAGTALGEPLLTDADGTGDVSFAFAGDAFDNKPGRLPVKDVVITVTDAGFGAGLGNFTVTVAATQSNGAACFSLADGCNVGELITTAVLPGNLELFAGEAAVDIPAVDLSTIDIQDNETWYPVSEPGAITQLLIGDMRGGNGGFVVTATVSDLVGGAQASNLIPKEDVFVEDSIDCQIFADVVDTPSESLGEIVVGVGQAGAGEPQGPADPSVMAEDGQELCTVGPDATGRAAGIFQIDANLIVAGRPITAADDYTGTLTITIAGN